MSNPSEIGARILMCRTRLRFSQQELADMIGIAATQYYRYEAGRTMPRPAMADRIADALGVSTQWLLTGEGDIERAKDEKLDTRDTPGIHVIPVDVPVTEMKLFKRHAKARGMTVEQWLKMLMYRAIDEFEAGKLSSPPTDAPKDD